MKIRNGFVSNSSSSSFIIKFKDITVLQQQQIVDHIEVAKQLTRNKEMFYDAWEITVKDDTIEGFACMDNFDMEWFLDTIGINTYKHVEWDTNLYNWDTEKPDED